MVQRLRQTYETVELYQYNLNIYWFDGLQIWTNVVAELHQY